MVKFFRFGCFIVFFIIILRVSVVFVLIIRGMIVFSGMELLLLVVRIWLRCGWFLIVERMVVGF